jgi:Bacterial Ig-like domain (group 2)
MKTIRFAFVALILALLSACPTATPESPKASSITVSGPTSNTLKLNEATAFTAIAKDASGSTILGKTFTWTSSDDKIAGVDSSGKVIAIHVGTVKISASMDGKTGASSSLKTYGLEFAVGQYTASAFPSPYSSTYYKFRKANGTTVSVDTPVSIIGPTGWNTGAAMSDQLYANDKYESRRIVTAIAVAGTYTISTDVDGEHFTASASLDLSSSLPLPTGLAVTNLTKTGLDASWNAVIGANSYTLQVLDCNGATTAAQCVDQGVTKSTVSTSASLVGLNLTGGKQYIVWLVARSIDITLEDPPTPVQYNLAGAGFDVTAP